jgi:CheY-like chemotaxis protein
MTVRLRSRRPAILVAEHDRAIQQLLSGTLRPAYHVVQAGSAAEAIRTAAQHREKIDLLITEARLPGPFGGWELLELLKLDYPKLKVVYVSKSIDPEIRAHTRRNKVLVLEHPFPKECLRQAVLETLEDRRAGRVDGAHKAPSFLQRLRNYFNRYLWTHRLAS